MKTLIAIGLIIFFLALIVPLDHLLAKTLDNLPGPVIMPDSPVYFIKIWYEKIIIFFTFGDANKAERFSELAERRLYEAEKMAEQGKEQLTQKLLEEYEKFLEKALNKANELKEEAERKTKEKIKQKTQEKLNNTWEQISESTLRNQEVLLKIYGLVPEGAKSAIGEAIRITRIGYENVLESFSGVKKDELIKKAEEIKIRAQETVRGWKSIFGE